MTARTDEQDWGKRAAALPGWDLLVVLIRQHLGSRRSVQSRMEDGHPMVRGIMTDFCERKGWLHAVHCRPGEPDSHTALYLLPDGRMSTTPVDAATDAVHALILAAEARHAADPARGWT